MTTGGEAEEADQLGQAEPTAQSVFDNRSAHWWEGGKQVEAKSEIITRKLDTPLDRLTRKDSGRRSQTRTERKRGRYIRAQPAGERRDDIAFDATFRAAAPFQRRRPHKNVAYAIENQDLQRKIRVKRAANLILFVVDASWSMAVAERMNATKGAIMSLLTDAYQRRDRVGLVVFQKDRALLVLPPTNSVVLAKKALAEIPVGGKTPLSAGLTLAYQVISQEKRLHPDVMPLLILLTDGAGNVSMSDLPPQEEAHRIADRIKADGIRSVTINMEHVAFDQGLAPQLAFRLGGPCFTLADLRAETLYETVKQHLE
ncbi:MAG TPA: VWA domain-containing protein [Aggregatilineales bacterium]|nr:VWA domain-containing protein [Aggregatilineales bacterium]